MSLSDIVTVNISAQTQSLARVGFGVPLIVCTHSHFTDRVRYYTNLADMVSDGFATGDMAYKMASALLAQNPSVSRFGIGRRALAPTQTIDLTPTITTVGHVYTVSINGLEATYTVVTSDTVALICEGLAAAINGLPNGALHTATDNTTKVTVAAVTAGVQLAYSNISAGLTFADVSTDPGIGTDLSAIQVASDDWYCVLLDSCSEAEIAACALWIESREKIFVAMTRDSGCLLSGTTTDIMSDLKTLDYARTMIIWHADTGNRVDAGAVGQCLPKDAGSYTWKFKNLSGISADKLSSSERNSIVAKNGNFYYSVASRAMLTSGVTPSGEWLDITQSIDWARQRLRERVANVLFVNDKVPFTDEGISLFAAEVEAQISEGISLSVFASDPAPVVIVPKASAISSIDRAARNLTGITFSVQLAGAIHNVVINGTLTV